jgi:DNA adenine methylase
MTPLPTTDGLAPLRPALRYHGGKFRLAPWILKHFPPHRCYVEPFGGAAGVLLLKPRSPAEVYNDLDGDVVNFFRVVRDPLTRKALRHACVFTPYARAEFDQAWEQTDDPVERARRTAVRASMGFGSAGATKGVTGFRIDTRRAYATAQDDWADYPSNLAAIGRRFERVLIECRPAVEVLLQHDAVDTLHYVDPPYVHSTRGMRGRAYRHEMSDCEHRELLDVLGRLRGMVLLSGYDSSLYADALPGWRRHSTRARISAGRGTAIREEVLWMNPACHLRLDTRHFALA